MTDSVTGLIQGIVTVLLEAAGLIVAIVIVARVLPRLGIRSGATAVATALVVGVVAIVVAAEDLSSSAADIAHAHRSTASIPNGRDKCLVEQGAASIVPFVHWLRVQIPAHAVYAVQSAGSPDAWCFALTLLPRLPAFASAEPEWRIIVGPIPSTIQARHARHDPAVLYFGPDMALVRLAADR